MFSEAILRDNLLGKLTVLESGLKFVEKEKYLPSQIGTRGFIDILAIDSNGRYVLIELKRSDSSARQALHEILKYVEGVKENLAVKEDEIRVFVVSTEWRELLVPFSSLKSRVSFSITGFDLEVSPQGDIVSSKKVDPIQLRSDRLFTSWHEIFKYTSLKSMRRGMGEIKKACLKKGIKDYVLIVLDISTEAARLDVHRKYNKLSALLGPVGEGRSFEEYLSRMALPKFVLYFSMLQLDVDYCKQKLKKLLSEDELAEWEESIEGVCDEELLLLCHVRMMNASPVAHFDDYEVSYPARFIERVYHEGWNVSEIIRSGAISSNQALLDEVIISEIAGDSGNTRQRYKKTLDSHGFKNLESVRKEVISCLTDNLQWKDQVGRVMSWLESLTGVTSVEISIFNPNHILLSLYFMCGKGEGLTALPYYYFKVRTEKELFLVFGFLEPNDKKPSMRAVIDKNFEGEYLNLLLQLQWGGYNSKDSLVCRDVGLSYETYLKDIEGDDAGRYRKLSVFGFEDCDEISHTTGLMSYLESNKAFIDDLVNFYSKFWDGVVFTYSRETYVFES